MVRQAHHHRKDVIVIGLGNVLLSDEGIGIHLVRRLSSQQKEFLSIEFVDAGTAGMSLLHLIANRKKAVVIDCAQMGDEPGTIRRFTSDEVKSIRKLSHYSLHEADILQVINLSKQLGECPNEVVFFGIQPETLVPSENLSKTLSDKIDDYIAYIHKDLALN
jgi:hydrogenase maturation protease